MLNFANFSSAQSGRGLLQGRQRFFFSVLIIAIFPVLAAAQSSQRMRDRDPDIEASKKLAAELQQANFHYGSWYLLSRFRISDAGFTETASLPTGDQSGGLSLSIEAPNRLYYVPHKKTIFTLELTPGYSWFNARGETEDERRTQFNYLGRADAHFLWNHLYLDLYTLRQDQLRAHVADINRLATVRTDETGVAGEAKYSSKTSALFNVRLRDMNFPESRFQPDGVPVQQLDRREKNARLGLMHKTLPLTSFFVAGERSDYEFGRATTKNSSRTYYGAGAIWNPDRTTVRLEAGPVTLDFDDPLVADYNGINASLAASRTSGRRLYNFGIERDLGFSIFAGNNYFISTTAHVGLTHAATRRLSLRAGSTYERDDYDIPVNGRDRRDTISFTSAGVIYAFRRLNIGADIGWYERTSTIGGEEDRGIRTIVHLSFTP